MNDESKNTQVEEDATVSDEQLNEVAGGIRIPRRFLPERLRNIGLDDGESASSDQGYTNDSE